jgi:hypothetical protein
MALLMVCSFVVCAWTAANGFGGDAAVTGETWPENELTKMLPEPDLILTKTAGGESFFAAEFNDATIEKVREYTERVKSEGFIIDSKIIETPAFAEVEETFYYAAANDGGYLFEVSYSGGGKANLTVKKP